PKNTNPTNSPSPEPGPVQNARRHHSWESDDSDAIPLTVAGLDSPKQPRAQRKPRRQRRRQAPPLITARRVWAATSGALVSDALGVLGSSYTRCSASPFVHVTV